MRQQTEFGEIPVDWQVKKIIDIKSDDKRAIAMGPFGSNIKADNFVPSGVPVIRGTNMNYAKYVDGNFVYLTDEKADELIGSNCKPDDLVFTHRGTIGQVALIPHNKYSRYVISQSGMKLTVNQSIVNSEFLFYFFKSDYGQYQILKYEAQVGVPSISNPLTSLKEMNVPVPLLTEQKAIASVLSSLDNKIDLLHRQNKTLESMAETLFRQWFVEEAQDDWDVYSLEEVSTISIGRTPPRKNKHLFSSDINDVKWLSIKDMGKSGIYRMYTEEYLPKSTIESFKIPIIPTNTVVLSFKMTVGRVGITHEEMVSNEAIAQFNIKKIISTEFLYCFLKQYNYDSLGTTSSIVTSINTGLIKSIQFSIPNDTKVAEFTQRTKPFFEKVKKNQMEIQTLEKLRDTLLPKLMSGEVRVNYTPEEIKQ